MQKFPDIRLDRGKVVQWCDAAFIVRNFCLCVDMQKKYSTMGSKTKQGKYHYLIQQTVFWNMSF